jgi:hypothetical protein
MSTIHEIEAAAEALPIGEKEELFRFLAARLGSKSTENAAFQPSDLRAFAGVLTLREEPLSYQNRARSEWS